VSSAYKLTCKVQRLWGFGFFWKLFDAARDTCIRDIELAMNLLPVLPLHWETNVRKMSFLYNLRKL